MTRHVWSIVVVGITLAIATWCYFNFEKVTEREYVGFSGAAARDALLAFERFAQTMGAGVRVVHTAKELEAPEPGATLVLAAHRQGMTPMRAAKLIRWVDSGGRLVVEAEAAGTRDVLLDALHVSRRAAKIKTALVEISIPGERRMNVTMGPAALIDTERRPGFTVAHGTGNALLQFAQGAGSVTVLPSFWFMENRQIGAHDHAAFAWAVLRLGRGSTDAPPVVLVVPGFERPSLLAWLATEALPAAVAAALLLALWLARAIPRFGPIVPQHDAARRRLLDHLRASGSYEWSAHASAKLLGAARERCLAGIAKARPALAMLDAAERSVRFAALTGLPQSEIDAALTGEATTPRAFIAAVQALQTIEQKLARRASA